MLAQRPPMTAISHGLGQSVSSSLSLPPPPTTISTAPPQPTPPPPPVKTPAPKKASAAKARNAASATKEAREKKNNFAASLRDDDDINDVAAMGGVNLMEESQRMATSTEFVGTQIRSCKDENFLLSNSLQNRINIIGTFMIKCEYIRLFILFFLSL